MVTFRKIVSLTSVLLLLLASGCGKQDPDITDETDDTTETISNSVFDPDENNDPVPVQRPPLPFPIPGTPEDICALPYSASAPDGADAVNKVSDLLFLPEGVTLEDGGAFDLSEGRFAVVKLMIGGEHALSFYVAEDYRIYLLAQSGELMSFKQPDLLSAPLEQYNAAMDMMSGGTIGWNVDYDLTYQPDEMMDPYFASNYLQFSTSEEFDVYLHHIFTENGIQQVLAGTSYTDYDGRLYLRGGNRGSTMNYAFHCYGGAVIWDDGSISFPLYSFLYETDDTGTVTGLIADEYLPDNAEYVLRNAGGVWLVDSLSMPY